MTRYSLFVLVILGLTGCGDSATSNDDGNGGTGDFPGSRVEGTEPGDCEDGADNDADSLFDCADTSCSASPVCSGGGAGGEGGAGGIGGAGGTSGMGAGGESGAGGVGGAGGFMLCAGVDCDDQNECTEDACDPMVGACVRANVTDGTSCDFGGFPGICGAGVCEDAMLCVNVDCDDGNQCTGDICNPMNGQCDNTSVMDGNACDFGGLPGVCTAGVCEDAMLCANVECDDGNQCTEDACNPMDGQCNNTSVIDGTFCDFSGAAGACGGGACVKAGSWGTPVLIDSTGANVSAIPHVAASSNGEVVVVWLNGSGTTNTVWATRYVPAQGWGTPERINVGTDSPNNPRVAIDLDGNAIAVWEEYDGLVVSVWTNRSAAGSGWGTPELLQTSGTSAGWPHVAFDPGGNAMAVWDQFDGAIASVWARRFTPALGWHAAIRISGDDAQNTRVPRVALDATGNAIVVWDHRPNNSSQYDIRTNRFTPAGGWGTVQVLGTGTLPDVAMDPDGNAIAVWMNGSSRYTPGDGWSGLGWSPGVRPKVAVDPAGNAVAVATDTAIRYMPADGSTVSERISPLDQPAGVTVVAVDTFGNAMAVWRSYAGVPGTTDIRANRFTPSSGWGVSEPIDMNSENFADAPEVAFDARGNATAVWWSWDGLQYSVWANRFE